MQVRIRRASEATARQLTTVGFDKLDTVIPALIETGLAGDDEGREMAGHIVIEEEGRSAYYEVVIDDGDDDE